MIRKTVISLIIISYSFILAIPPTKANEATITIGTGNGLPGEEERQIAVSLDNSDFRARGVQLEVCDEDDFISCAGCEGVDRASGFLCSANELPDGCCKILLLDLGGGNIAEGSGPIFTIDYDVSEEAPVGECRKLNPKVVGVVFIPVQPLNSEMNNDKESTSGRTRHHCDRLYSRWIVSVQPCQPEC
jgi:hypothetical protein